MESARIQQGQTERIESYFVNTGLTPLSGLSPTLTIRRLSDKAYWTGNQDFTSVFAQVTMSAVDPTNQGGYYERTFDTTGLADDTYYIISSGTGAANSPQTGELKVGGYIDNLDASVTSMQSLGGGAVVHIDGILGKKDKKILFDLVKDEIEKIIALLNDINIKIDRLKSLNPNSSIETTLENIKTEIYKLAEYENRLLQYNEELSTIEKEVLSDQN